MKTAKLTFKKTLGNAPVAVAEEHVSLKMVLFLKKEA